MRHYECWAQFTGTCLLIFLCGAVSLLQAASPTSPPASVIPVLVWQTWLPEKHTLHIYGANASCIIVLGEGTDVAYDSRSYPLYGIRLTDGAVLWKQSFTDIFSNDSALDDKNIYVKIKVGKGQYVVNAINCQDGMVRWRYENVSIDGKILAAGDQIYLIDQQGGMVALLASTGEQVWRRPSHELPVDQPLTLAILNGIVYIGQKRVAALNAATGEVIRQRQITDTESALYNLFPPIWSGEDRVLIFPEGDFGVGVEYLRLRALHEDLTLAWYRANYWDPVLANHVLVCEDSTRPYSRSGIVGLDPKTGKLRWARRGRSVNQDDVIGAWQQDVVINHQQELLAGVNPQTGKVTWRLPHHISFPHYVFSGEWMVLAPYRYDATHPAGKIVAYRKPAIH